MFIFLLKTQDLNKIKKIPNTLLSTLLSRKRVKFQQKILNFVVVGGRQIFQFLRQIAWFLVASSKFRHRILYN